MADRISIDAPMTLTDHQLVYALQAIVIRVCPPAPARAAMLRDELQRVCRLSDSRNSRVRDLKAMAEQVISAAPGSPEMSRARVDAADALADFAEWRLACALADRRGEAA